MRRFFLNQRGGLRNLHLSQRDFQCLLRDVGVQALCGPLQQLRQNHIPIRHPPPLWPIWSDGDRVFIPPAKVLQDAKGDLLDEVFGEAHIVDLLIACLGFCNDGQAFQIETGHFHRSN